MDSLKPIWLYRITHISNLNYIFKHGLFTRNSPMFDPDYVSIGDVSLIGYREQLEATNPPGGKLQDYIPFYLGPRSPMLYQIAKGDGMVTKFPQEEIIYLISSFQEIKTHNLSYFFTDGHARSNTSNKYNSEDDFSKIDEDGVYATYWKSDETDLTRQQKKQAEFLIKDHVPISCINYIGTFSEQAKEKVLLLLEQQNLNIEIKVSPKKLYYDNL
jgi:hypothetical protein